MLGDDCVTYYGEVSNEQRSENKAIFMDGSKRYFVGNAQTGGIGLNLTVAATVVYYSNTFSYGNRAQSEDRAHRIGQESDKVTYIDIEADDTIDEKIVGSLIAKKNMSQFMLEMGDITS
jgi:SNF2 family DNA or RNA helicase